MREWIAHNEFTIFVVFMFALVIVLSIVLIGGENHATSRTRHYQCYSGGVLVIDKEYPLNGIGNVLDPETHERVYFKGMDCVYK